MLSLIYKYNPSNFSIALIFSEILCRVLALGLPIYRGSNRCFFQTQNRSFWSEKLEKSFLNYWDLFQIWFDYESCQARQLDQILIVVCQYLYPTFLSQDNICMISLPFKINYVDMRLFTKINYVDLMFFTKIN